MVRVQFRTLRGRVDTRDYEKTRDSGILRDVAALKVPTVHAISRIYWQPGEGRRGEDGSDEKQIYRQGTGKRDSYGEPIPSRWGERRKYDGQMREELLARDGRSHSGKRDYQGEGPPNAIIRRRTRYGGSRRPRNCDMAKKSSDPPRDDGAAGPGGITASPALPRG